MRIAFVVNTFPKRSETFILNQVTGLLDLGHDVQIFYHSKEKERKVRKDFQKYNLKRRSHYIPDSMLNLVEIG